MEERLWFSLLSMVQMLRGCKFFDKIVPGLLSILVMDFVGIVAVYINLKCFFLFCFQAPVTRGKLVNLPPS